MSISGPWWLYGYEIEKERRVNKEPSLSDDLRQVANEMERVANRMMDEGVFNKTQTGKRLRQHGLGMLGAASIAKEWANEIEKEEG